MKKLVLIVSMYLMIHNTQAQQEAMFSQYMFNGLFLNPGYTGSHPYLSSTVMHRDQWVKFEGAPKTSSVSIDAPVAGNKMGLGFLLVHDKIGVTDQTDLFVNYSYKVKAGNGNVSFGVKGGASQQSARLSSLTVWDENDNVFAGDKTTKWVPKFGFGTYYSTNTFYAGFAIPTLLAYDADRKFMLDPEAAADVRKHYFFNAGYVITLTQEVKVKPSFLVKYVKAAPVQADLNVNFLLHDVLWIGTSYRTGDAVVAMVEFQATKNIRIGYGYDFTTSEMNRYSKGTHEIMIGYDLHSESIKVKTPRFF